MGVVTRETVRVRADGPVCFVQLHRPEADNTVSDQMIVECRDVLAAHGPDTTVFVLEGLPHVFSMGADFAHMRRTLDDGTYRIQDPAPLYDLWLELATGPFVTIAHVRGKVNAGGVGFAAANDIVIADETAQFSLSELLFGLLPACVLPFLIRRVGFQTAHYLTLTTQPISARQALACGLVDVCEANSETALARHLRRLRPLSKVAIARYKRYAATIDRTLIERRGAALDANREVFSSQETVRSIARYVATGLLPWEHASR